MSKDYDKQKILEIYNKATKAINKTVREIIGGAADKYKTNNKGGIGNLIQEYYFGIPANNLSEPDFLDLNLELKIIPLKKSVRKNDDLEYTVKERLVFNMINYNSIVNETSLENSSFISKNRIILLMSYIHDYEIKDKLDYKINGAYLLDLKNIKEYEFIKNDWSQLVDKIRSGKADTLSERDTLILKACTKGGGENAPVIQPNSNNRAKKRAFSFSATFMTQIIHRLNRDKDNISNFLSDNDFKYTKYFSQHDIESYLNSLIGENLKNYAESSSKQWRRMAFDNLLKIKYPEISDFLKNSEYLLTVINSTNKIPNEQINTKYYLDPSEMVNEEFEESTFYQDIILKTFLIVLVDKITNKIDSIKLFKLNDDEVRDAEKVFNLAKKELIRIGELNSNDRIRPNFTKIKDNMTIHIRTWARNSSDVYKNSNAKYHITKHTFWINKKTVFSK